MKSKRQNMSAVEVQVNLIIFRLSNGKPIQFWFDEMRDSNSLFEGKKCNEDFKTYQILHHNVKVVYNIKFRFTLASFQLLKFLKMEGCDPMGDQNQEIQTYIFLFICLYFEFRYILTIFSFRMTLIFKGLWKGGSVKPCWGLIENLVLTSSYSENPQLSIIHKH